MILKKFLQKRLTFIKNASIILLAVMLTAGTYCAGKLKIV